MRVLIKKTRLNTLFGKLDRNSAKGILQNIFLPLVIFSSLSIYGQNREGVETVITSIEAYEKGFVYDVMRSPSGEAVMLNNHVLMENDGPGSGLSMKGSSTESLHKGVLIRKELYLENASAKRAHVVFFMVPSDRSMAPSPYYLLVNGVRVPGDDPFWKEPGWRWIEIPVSLLNLGKNEVILGCDAPKGKGYDLYFAREDEYDEGGGKYIYQGSTAMTSADQLRLNPDGSIVSGGGTQSFGYFSVQDVLGETSTSDSISLVLGPDGRMPTLDRSINSERKKTGLTPIEVGASSYKSVDGGKTWIAGKIGADNDVVGEYTIRLHLERFKARGILDSPPLDLWAASDSVSAVLPNSLVRNVELEVNAYVPNGTEVVWQARTSPTKDMLSEEWGDWQVLGKGGNGEFSMKGKVARYLQWRAVLETGDLLRTPEIKEVVIRRHVEAAPIPDETYYVKQSENTNHRYSSFLISYEDALHPELKSLQKRLEMPKLLQGVQGDFEEINRLRHHVSTLWYHALPEVEYPEWNAHDILDRNERLGAGGMCIQFSIIFMQGLQSLGYHARHVNIFAHETIEVYVDELGSWVHVDPESMWESYEFNSQTGMPVDILTQHDYFLKEFGFSAENPIDWTSTQPWAGNAEGVKRRPQPLNYSTFTDYVNDSNNPPPQHTLAGHLRFVPRTDFLSRPGPRPLTQGMIEWPWNGYVNWYDAATPRKLQYTLHTDREADLYPTLGRVEYTATYGKKEGEIDVQMITVTPNFETFEVNINGQGWQSSPKDFIWKLRPSALNRLEMRTRNTAGKVGKSSELELFWHYREPFKPREK